MKTTVKLKLLTHQNLIGHCQLTYTCLNSSRQRLVYCLQDQGERFGGVRAMRCTQEGEPEYQVDFREVRAVFEKPTPGKYDSDYALRLKLLCSRWIERYEEANCG